MKKTIKLTEAELVTLIQNVISEQYEEKLKDDMNSQPTKLFLDKNEKNVLGVGFVDEIFKNPDGSLNLYFNRIKFSNPSFGTKSGFRILVFKCGEEGLLSKGNQKRIYSNQINTFLNKNFCKK